MKYYKEIGNHGEDFVAMLLMDRGHEIVCRNYRTKTGEIDIITKKHDCYHFIEVKTRTSDEYGRPMEAVSIEKQRRIKRTAEFFMLSQGIEDCMVEFDVIEVEVNMMWGCF